MRTLSFIWFMMYSIILRLTDRLDMKLEVLNLKSVKEKVKAYALLGVRRGYK